MDQASMPTQTTILNVDDVPSMRYGKSRVLTRAGYTVLEAGTGAEALKMVRERMPHLVLMDVNLPDMSGIEACRRIKADPATRSIPVVQVSATFISEHDREIGLGSGADIYLTEPIEPKELETVVDVLLRMRRTEAGLRQTEERWRRFVDSNIIGVVVVEDGRIVEANDRFLQLVGYDRDDLSDGELDCRTITPPEHREESERVLRTLMETGSVAPCQMEYLRKDGSRVSVAVGSTLLDRERRRWMNFVLDMSEQKRIELEREHAFRREHAARMQAEEATRLKDEFLANLSHELRTPMNIIIGWANLLRTGALSPEQQRRAMDAIERAARSQAQLIEDLLDVSRIVTGKFRLSMQVVALGPAVEAAVESLRPTAQSRRIALHTQLEAADAEVVGDADRLQQVVWNLVSNAVKFTPEGGSVYVRLWRTDKSAIISVADTGIGISPEFLPYVFDRFRQADGTSTREHKGMGLGLSIVRHVVELHGGTVEAASPGRDQGATFTVTLPLAAPHDRHDKRDGTGSEPAGTHHTAPAAPVTARVLLVEDDPAAREMTAAALEHAGFEVRTASAAREALDLLDVWMPDIVVSDISMPEMDGYEFIHHLRSRSPERGGRLPALALTAFARVEDAARALACGYQGHLAKPFGSQDLANAIAALAGGGAHARNRAPD